MVIKVVLYALVTRVSFRAGCRLMKNMPLAIIITARTIIVSISEKPLPRLGRRCVLPGTVVTLLKPCISRNGTSFVTGSISLTETDSGAVGWKDGKFNGQTNVHVRGVSGRGQRTKGIGDRALQNRPSNVLWSPD